MTALSLVICVALLRLHVLDQQDAHADSFPASLSRQVDLNVDLTLGTPYFLELPFADCFGDTSCRAWRPLWSNTADYYALTFIRCSAQKTQGCAELHLYSLRQVTLGSGKTARFLWKSCASFGTLIQAMMFIESSASVTCIKRHDG